MKKVRICAIRSFPLTVKTKIEMSIYQTPSGMVLTRSCFRISIQLITVKSETKMFQMVHPNLG